MFVKAEVSSFRIVANDIVLLAVDNTTVQVFIELTFVDAHSATLEIRAVDKLTWNGVWDDGATCHVSCLRKNYKI